MKNEVYLIVYRRKIRKSFTSKIKPYLIYSILIDFPLNSLSQLVPYVFIPSKVLDYQCANVILANWFCVSICSQLASACYMQRIDLSAHGFYITPEIGFDWRTGKGNPFRYFTYGAAFAEVEIDTLTGDFHTRTANIILDLGYSLNPTIDVGQVPLSLWFFTIHPSLNSILHWTFNFVFYCLMPPSRTATLCITWTAFCIRNYC